MSPAFCTDFVEIGKPKLNFPANAFIQVTRGQFLEGDIN